MRMESDRLFLVRHTPEALLALIEHPDEYEEISGFPAAHALREFFVSEAVSPAFLEYLRSRDHSNPWLPGFGVVHRESGIVIGSAGFKGAPDASGMVEVGYGIVPAYEGRGYATEVTKMLVTWAFASGQVRVVRAHTLPEANASTRVLGKCGFGFEGEVVDPEDGRVWRWEKMPGAESRSSMKATAPVVCIIVDPDIGERLSSLAMSMPVWIADTDANRETVRRFNGERDGRPASHTGIGQISTFRVGPSDSPAESVIAILLAVDLHHGRYSQSPPYYALEIIGATATKELRHAVAEYGMETIVETAEGFRAE